MICPEELKDILIWFSAVKWDQLLFDFYKCAVIFNESDVKVVAIYLPLEIELDFRWERKFYL